MPSPRIGTLLLAASCLLTAACRDAVAPYDDGGREPREEDLVQLTFDVANERDPQFTPDGTAIFYHSDRWYDTPALREVMLRLPATGGVARLLAPAAQPDAFYRLLLPVPSPDGTRVAYLQFAREASDPDCTYAGDVCPVRAPRLDSAVVRVRAIGVAGSVSGDPGVSLLFEGPDRQIQPEHQIVHPYQFEYGEEEALSSLRSSWSQDGTRLVFSDGLRLRLWRIGEVVAQPIPNTDGGVAPSWSPDGQWIAFTVIRRGESSTVACNCGSDSAPLLVDRTWWPVVEREIAVIRPDGSGLRTVTTGAEAAWTSGSDSLYFRRDNDGLFRMALAGGAATSLADTEFARAPMLAPGGEAVVFARRGPLRPDFNLWTLRLH